MASKQESTDHNAPKMAFLEEQPRRRIPTCRYSKRVMLKTILGWPDGGLGLVGERVVVGGWVKSSREVKKQPQPSPEPQSQPQQESNQRDPNVTCTEILQSPAPLFWSFMKILGLKDKDFDSALGQPVASDVILQVNDGSCASNLQVVVDSALVPPEQAMLSGTCVLVEGFIQRPLTSGKNSIELKAEKVLHLGVVEDHEKYPLSKKRLPLHSLRDWTHIRPRTTTIASITRIRNALNHATHNFFQSSGFLHVQVPIITTTDTEGFSNKFRVTSLLSKMTREESSNKPSKTTEFEGASLESMRTSLTEKRNRVEELKRTDDSNKEALETAMEDIKNMNELVSQLEGKEKVNEKEKSAALMKPDRLNFLDDYFSCKAFLTISGRLHLESYASALGNVYAYGPRFKAETFQSTRRVSEMWMVEAEMAFAEFEEAMSCATDFLKHLSKWVVENCADDMKFILKRVDQGIVARLQSIALQDFEKVSYAQAIEILKQVKGKNFDLNVEFGIPLTEELESYLANEIYKKPVIIFNYPKEVKPFYVRQNDDGKTVAAFDVIVPKVGAVIRGSQNEERIKILTTRIKELGLSSEQYEWYLDLRRYGTMKHAGFSLNFDLMLLLATGITDVRDVIPFPRSYGRATC